MALPPLTDEQRAQALDKAAAARKIRAEVKSKLKSRELKLSEVLERAKSDEALSKMKVVTLLESLPRVGSTTANAVMQEVGIAASRRIRGLGIHQREELIRRFG
ncbi:MAG: integration host factor, actinobacterial type [Actinomycetaceae bacterium]|nr:integration host factor, actinobacterial type [Actinomycetaceae bacterium]